MVTFSLLIKLSLLLVGLGKRYFQVVDRHGDIANDKINGSAAAPPAPMLQIIGEKTGFVNPEATANYVMMQATIRTCIADLAARFTKLLEDHGCKQIPKVYRYVNASIVHLSSELVRVPWPGRTLNTLADTSLEDALKIRWEEEQKSKSNLWGHKATEREVQAMDTIASWGFHEKNAEHLCQHEILKPNHADVLDCQQKAANCVEVSPAGGGAGDPHAKPIEKEVRLVDGEGGLYIDLNQFYGSEGASKTAKLLPKGNGPREFECKDPNPENSTWDWWLSNQKKRLLNTFSSSSKGQPAPKLVKATSARALPLREQSSTIAAPKLRRAGSARAIMETKKFTPTQRSAAGMAMSWQEKAALSRDRQMTNKEERMLRFNNLCSLGDKKADKDSRMITNDMFRILFGAEWAGYGFAKGKVTAESYMSNQEFLQWHWLPISEMVQSGDLAALVEQAWIRKRNIQLIKKVMSKSYKAEARDKHKNPMSKLLDLEQKGLWLAVTTMEQVFDFSIAASEKACLKKVRKAYGARAESAALAAKVMRELFETTVKSIDRAECLEKPPVQEIPQFCPEGYSPQNKPRKEFVAAQSAIAFGVTSPLSVWLHGLGFVADGNTFGMCTLLSFFAGWGAWFAWVFLAVAYEKYNQPCSCNEDDCKFSDGKCMIMEESGGKRTFSKNPFRGYPFPGSKCALKSGHREECERQPCSLDDFKLGSHPYKGRSLKGIFGYRAGDKTLYNCLTSSDDGSPDRTIFRATPGIPPVDLSQAANGTDPTDISTPDSSIPVPAVFNSDKPFDKPPEALDIGMDVFERSKLYKEIVGKFTPNL